MPAIPKDVREKLVALGKRIRALRETGEASRWELANEVEMKLTGSYRRQTPGMIRGIEMGRTFMTVREVKVLAYVLGDASIGDEYERLKQESGQ